MKVIILSAGRCSRMLPLTLNIPKSLLKLPNNKVILENQLDVISNYDIDEVIFVVGYLSDKIEQKIKICSKKYKDITIKSIYNPFFDTSDNLISLWMSRYEMNDDFIVMNGDNYITDIVMDIHLKSNDEICMVIDRKDNYTIDDMKVITNNDEVLKIGKNIHINSVNGESIGQIKFIKSGIKKMRMVLDEIVRLDGSKKYYWLEAIQKLIDNKNIVNYVEVPNDSWLEIDIHRDYVELNTYINNQLKKIIKN